ncbi:MAG TPA: TolC family protein, partial [Ignavibacteria bacterium]|nr:TolC family protein [Ignavibacteria bacterium]
MKRTITILLLVFSLNAFAQQTLTLDECYSSARRNYPSLKQKPFNDSLSGNKLNNYDIGYLPKISFGAQASYQSDVTKLNINVPFIQMPDINKDRYQFTMDVKQLIYDGGNISSLKDIEKSSLQVDQQKIEVELYALKQRVNDLYFNVLISKEKRKSLDITASDISDRIAEQ